MATETLRLGVLSLDPNMRIRADGLNDRIVDEYVDLYIREAEGEPVGLPEVRVYQDGDTYWLADGFHRYAARERGGFNDIDCEVIKGDRMKALGYALQANDYHGLRRTPADKRVAVKVAFKEFGANQSNGAIASICNVSHWFVSQIRAELESEGVIAETDVRTGKDGKIRTTQPATATPTRNVAGSDAEPPTRNVSSSDAEPPTRCAPGSAKKSVDPVVDRAKSQGPELIRKLRGHLENLQAPGRILKLLETIEEWIR